MSCSERTFKKLSKQVAVSVYHSAPPVSERGDLPTLHLITKHMSVVHGAPLLLYQSIDHNQLFQGNGNFWSYFEPFLDYCVRLLCLASTSLNMTPQSRQFAVHAFNISCSCLPYLQVWRVPAMLPLPLSGPTPQEDPQTAGLHLALWSLWSDWQLGMYSYMFIHVTF